MATALILGMSVTGASASAAQTPPPTATVQPTVNLGDQSDLFGVSCVATNTCMAIGFAENDGVLPVQPVAEQWDGSSWTAQTLPMPSQTQDVLLHDVSCPSASFCMAVGEYTATDPSGHSEQLTLAERWNGKAWKILDTPNDPYVSGAHNDNVLTGVSCSGPRACTADGTFETQVTGSAPSGTDVPVIERWDGQTWQMQASATAGDGTDTVLTRVACPKATACLAVGSADNQPFAETWDGTTWTAQPAPAPGGDQGVYQDVSCSGPSACTAAGSYDTGSGFIPLAERWDGTAFTAQTVAEPADKLSGGYLGLYGISCASGKSCTAVGHYQSSATYADETLGERWNGRTWSVFTTQNPGAAFSDFTDVSCAAPTACEAVGDYSTDNSTFMTLAEGFSG